MMNTCVFYVSNETETLSSLHLTSFSFTADPIT